MRKILKRSWLISAFLFCGYSYSQQINSAEYFFDADPGVGKGTAITVTTPADSVDVSSSVNVSALSVGFHSLFVRVRNANGIWSLYEGRRFYINAASTTTQVQIVRAEYFIDSDPGVGNGTTISTGALADSVDVTSTVNTTGLPAGFHSLFVRVLNQSGIWSLYEGRRFYINPTPVSSQLQIVKAEYFIDSDPGIGNGTAVSTGSLADSVDVTSSVNTTGLPLGFHSLFLRVLNQSGVWSLYEGRRFFLDSIQPNLTQIQIVNAESFFDVDPGEGNGTAVTPSFAAADSVDLFRSIAATGLPIGVHYLYTRVQDQLGLWSLSIADTFSVGNVGINELNGNSGIIVFPNPSNGNFVLAWHSLAPGSEVHIKDITGRDIYFTSIGETEGSRNINLSAFSNGMYFWEVISKNELYARGKVVIVKEGNQNRG